MCKQSAVSAGLCTALALVLTISLPAAADWDAGVAAFQTGNYDEALQEFQKIAASRPDEPQGVLMLGQTLLQLQQYEEAVVALEQVERLRPDNSTHQLPLGQAYIKTGRYQDAVRILSASVVRAPAQQVVKSQLLALAQSKSGAPATALRTLANAAVAHPDNAALQYQYGTAALNSGGDELAMAVTVLERAVELDPTREKQRVLTQALVQHAQQLDGEPMHALYLQAVESAQALAGNQPNYDDLLLLGEAQLGTKNYTAAIESLERASTKSVSDWYSYYYLGQAQTFTNDYPKAVDSLQQALTRVTDEHRPQVLSLLGLVYEKQKDWNGAKSAYERAGDPAGVERVTTNEQTARENREIERTERELEKLRRAREAIDVALEKLHEDGGP